jgi:NADH-quinone oxidoreductase subunit J
MSGLQIIIILVSIVTLISGFMVVIARKMMHAALWLVLTLFGVAILFATLQASFFAVIQVLVYIGAIAILIIFSIMLTQRVLEDQGEQLIRRWWLPALVAMLLFGLIATALSLWNGFNNDLVELNAGAENLTELGKALVDPAGYTIPFEVASVLLLAALVGSIYVAVIRKEKSS